MPARLLPAEPGRRGGCHDGTAESLPFADRSFDAAMAVSTVHHWQDPVAGLREMRRVARRVVVLTFDASEDVLRRRFWLTRDYLLEFAGLFNGWPSLAGLAGAIGCHGDMFAATGQTVSRGMHLADCRFRRPEPRWPRGGCLGAGA